MFDYVTFPRHSVRALYGGTKGDSVVQSAILEQQVPCCVQPVFGGGAKTWPVLRNPANLDEVDFDDYEYTWDNKRVDVAIAAAIYSRFFAKPGGSRINFGAHDLGVYLVMTYNLIASYVHLRAVVDEGLKRRESTDFLESNRAWREMFAANMWAPNNARDASGSVIQYDHELFTTLDEADKALQNIRSELSAYAANPQMVADITRLFTPFWSSNKVAVLMYAPVGKRLVESQENSAVWGGHFAFEDDDPTHRIYTAEKRQDIAITIRQLEENVRQFVDQVAVKQISGHLIRVFGEGYSMNLPANVSVADDTTMLDHWVNSGVAKDDHTFLGGTDMIIPNVANKDRSKRYLAIQFLASEPNDFLVANMALGNGDDYDDALGYFMINLKDWKSGGNSVNVSDDGLNPYVFMADDDDDDLGVYKIPSQVWDHFTAADATDITSLPGLKATLENAITGIAGLIPGGADIALVTKVISNKVADLITSDFSGIIANAYRLRDLDLGWKLTFQNRPTILEDYLQGPAPDDPANPSTWLFGGLEFASQALADAFQIQWNTDNNISLGGGVVTQGHMPFFLPKGDNVMFLESSALEAKKIQWHYLKWGFTASA